MCEALVVVSMPAIPPVACHSASIDRFSLLHSYPPSSQCPSFSSVLRLTVHPERADAFSSSSTPLFLLSSFHLHAYASRNQYSLTNLIYERRRPAKDLLDESLRPKPIHRDRGSLIVATCNELYSQRLLRTLHLSDYKRILLRINTH